MSRSASYGCVVFLGFHANRSGYMNARSISRVAAHPKFFLLFVVPASELYSCNKGFSLFPGVRPTKQLRLSKLRESSLTRYRFLSPPPYHPTVFRESGFVHSMHGVKSRELTPACSPFLLAIE